jgi:cytochrome c oxidase accessory protein FixG
MSIIEVETKQADSFRNKLANVDLQGKRHKIYPQKPKGRFYNKRTVVSWFLLAFLFLSPFVKVNGEQFMLFNILERKFIILGIVFFPQDFYIVVLGILTALVSVVLFTAVLGRVWCGWLCPQTVFLEMLFRKIEYAIEGNHVQQRLLDSAEWSTSKIAKKVLKHGLYYAISFAIGNTFLAYLIGSSALIDIITHPPSEHIVGFSIMIAFSLVFYGVFARFREQACVVVCPYGRYQSALVDKNTVLVTYDFKRGEPRGKFSKEDKAHQVTKSFSTSVVGIDELATDEEAHTTSKGDCIDCKQCVTVCPTGIDIRNGIQLECVNCTACIDACDTIMDKVKKPRGLIRYASLEGINNPASHWLTTRVKAYFAVWAIVVSLFSYFFFTRPMTEVLILRQAGSLSASDAKGQHVNFYTIQMVNKNFHDVPVEVKVAEPNGASLTMLGDIHNVPKVSEKTVRFMVALPNDVLVNGDSPITFRVFSNGALIKEVRSRFLTTQSSSYRTPTNKPKSNTDEFAYRKSRTQDISTMH